MKKVRNIVTAIAVLAVVGGALAFKSTNLGGGFVCDISSHAGPCPEDIEYGTDAGTTPMFCQPITNNVDCTTPLTVRIEQ